MKPTREIIAMLVRELVNHLDQTKFTNLMSVYYNEVLGDISFLLAGLLQSLLKEKSSEWDKGKWIDDSLITNIVIQNNKLIIGGVMIWGKTTTEQWTDPYLFEIELTRDEPGFKEFTFWFCDLNNPGITYEEFRDNRGYWTASTSTRNWKYIISLSYSEIG